jgi:hypothetical protein
MASDHKLTCPARAQGAGHALLANPTPPHASPAQPLTRPLTHPHPLPPSLGAAPTQVPLATLAAS